MKIRMLIMIVALILATGVVAIAEGEILDSGTPSGESAQSRPPVTQPATAGYAVRYVTVNNTIRKVYVRVGASRAALRQETSARKAEDSRIRGYIADERQVRQAVDGQLDRKIDAVGTTASAALAIAQQTQISAPTATEGSQKESGMTPFQIVMTCIAAVILGVLAWIAIAHQIRTNAAAGGGASASSVAGPVAARTGHHVPNPSAKTKQTGNSTHFEYDRQGRLVGIDNLSYDDTP